MFTSDAVSFLQLFFNMLVSMFSITIPGTNITFLGLALSVFATTVVIGIAKQFISFGISEFGSGVRDLYSVDSDRSVNNDYYSKKGK